jgi:hypothetical protein
MPDGERGSGLGDRSHGGELPKCGGLDPVEENYKPIATGPNAAKSIRGMGRMNWKRRKKGVSEQQDWRLNLDVVHANAAGIDIGNESRYVLCHPIRTQSRYGTLPLCLLYGGFAPYGSLAEKLWDRYGSGSPRACIGCRYTRS